MVERGIAGYVVEYFDRHPSRSEKILQRGWCLFGRTSLSIKGQQKKLPLFIDIDF